MSCPADYQFSFHFTNPKIVQEKMDLSELWISPDIEKVELVMDAEGKYIQLDNNKSVELFEILSGEKLSDFQ